MNNVSSCASGGGGGGGTICASAISSSVLTLGPTGYSSLKQEEWLFGDITDRSPHYNSVAVDGELKPTYDICPGVMYVSDFKADACYFHYLVWLSSTDVTPKHTIVWTRREDAYLAFSSSQDLEDFTAWLSHYKSRFGDCEIDKVCVPTPPLGRFSGEVVEKVHQDDSATEMSVWAWLIKNIRGAVYYIPRGKMLFTESVDAINYKLRWNNSNA